MKLNFDNILKQLKEGNIDISKLTSGEKDKEVKEVSIWDNDSNDGYNEKIMTKDGFVNSLYDDASEAPFTKAELGQIYDLINADDGDEKMTGEELEKLAAVSGDGQNISTKDINEFLSLLEDEAQEAGIDVSTTSKSETVTADGKTVVTETETTVKVEKSDGANEADEADETGETKETQEAGAVSQLQDDERIKTDDDGNKYVNVEAWSNDNDSNNCLSRIINNSYDLDAMGIKLYSEEYYALEKAVMDANPEIYGTEESGWRKEVGGSGRHSAVLYTNDKIVLPEYTV